jgi:hypothetical protein
VFHLGSHLIYRLALTFCHHKSRSSHLYCIPSSEGCVIQMLVLHYKPSFYSGYMAVVWWREDFTVLALASVEGSRRSEARSEISIVR